QLTEIGEVYIRNAKEMLRLKETTYHQISDILNVESRSFRMGIAPGRGIRMFTAVYPKFLKRYPKVSISPIEMSSYRQQSMIADEKLDIGFLTISDSEKINCGYTLVRNEELFVAVPRDHPLSLAVPEREGEIPEIGIRELADESFVVMYPGSSCRFITNNIFAKAGMEPRILFETSVAASIGYFVASGLCCGFIPEYYARERDDIRLFALDTHPTWEVAFCYSRISYLSKPLKEFIRMCVDYWDHYYNRFV
ncbi:MAG: LysR family transcriptional regulator substrate-binding protein, partial [Clostridiales bacterium]|nr:LysR family transcriptional regulator substrate-binding protein [Clostridiales bacterium]